MKRIIFSLIFMAASVSALAWSEGPAIKFATYAVRPDTVLTEQRSWQNCAPAVAETIASLDCDILALQSIPSGEKGLFTDSREWIRRSETGAEELAIGLRPGMFETLQTGVFYLGGNYDKPVAADDLPAEAVKACIWAKLRHKSSEKELYVLTTHLAASPRKEDGKLNDKVSKYNAKQMRQWAIDNLPDGTPSVLLGNLNVDHRDKHWGSFAQWRWIDTKRWYGFAGILKGDMKDNGTITTADGEAPGKWNPDHIMFNSFRPVAFYADRNRHKAADGSLIFPSTHFPVCAELLFRDYNDYGPKTEGPKKKELRVVSFNLRYWNNNADNENGWDHRKFAIPLMVRDIEPDVMGTQEPTVLQNEYIKRECPDYQYIGILRDGKEGGEMASIFYNTRTVTLQDWGGFWLSETPGVASKGWDAAIRRTATWARFRLERTGKEFIFVNTHLDHKGKVARKKGLDLILDTLKVLNPKKLPVVITGDFNVTPNNNTLDRIKEEMKNTRTTAISSDDKYSFNGFGKTWNGTIDYIWYDGFKKCTDFKVISRQYGHVNYISDHYPIRADLEIK